MNTASVREQVIARLDSLSDEQIAALLAYIEAMTSTTPPNEYDPQKDPTIGMFSGPSDLASRTKEILRAEFGLRRPE
jgi:hypothetical protein